MRQGGGIKVEAVEVGCGNKNTFSLFLNHETL